MEKRLYRDEYHKKLAGVCAGLAEYFAIDPVIVRVLFVLTCIFHGGGGLVYIVLWIVVPKKPYPYFDPTVDYRVPPQNPDAQSASSPGHTAFGETTFSNNPFPNPPFVPQPRGTSLAAIIFGIVLIVVGGSILLDNFDIIPDWDLWHLWPVIPIIIGCVLMLSGQKKKPIDNAGWAKVADDKTTDTTSETNPPVDNPPAV